MKRFLFLVFLTATLTGCSATPEMGTSTLRDQGTAPELNNTVWLNTEIPLRLADLKGKVVLLDMWTYG